MCAPTVIRSVREEFSRRGFLTTVGAAVAAAAVPAIASAQTQRPLRLGKGFRDVHDLTPGDMIWVPPRAEANWGKFLITLVGVAAQVAAVVYVVRTTR